MRIGFTAQGPAWGADIDARFGRTKYLLVYDEEKDELLVHDNTSMSEQQHGAGPGTASKLFELNVNVLITGNGPGSNAAGLLEKAGVKIYTGAGELNVKEAYEHYKNKKLHHFN